MIFIYSVLLCSNSSFYLLYIAFIYLVVFTSLLSVGCQPEPETPPDVLTNQIWRESSIADCLGQKAALKSTTKRNANLVLLQKTMKLKRYKIVWVYSCMCKCKFLRRKPMMLIIS